jgi:hypothetical protein
MITDEHSITVEGQRKTIHYNSINTDFDVVLSGHYHPGFGIKTNPFGTVFANPGALMRLSYDEYDKKRKPSIVHVKVEKRNVELELIEVPHKKDVWDIARVEGVATSEDERHKFSEALDSLRDEDFMSGNVLDLIGKVSRKKELKGICSKKVIKMCKEKILELTNE